LAQDKQHCPVLFALACHIIMLTSTLPSN